MNSNDAITIVWHKGKIGIDIERTNRDFNHIKFAKKYDIKSIVYC